MFKLDDQLQSDTVLIGYFGLSLLLLHRDCQYPWCILVPQRAGITEVYQLDEPDQQQLWRESAVLSREMTRLFTPDKLNLAAIGNIVSQLHIHHVARFRQDPCWPKPVWGCLPAVDYRQYDLDRRVKALQEALVDKGFTKSR